MHRWLVLASFVAAVSLAAGGDGGGAAANADDRALAVAAASAAERYALAVAAADYASAVAAEDAAEASLRELLARRAAWGESESAGGVAVWRRLAAVCTPAAVAGGTWTATSIAGAPPEKYPNRFPKNCGNGVPPTTQSNTGGCEKSLVYLTCGSDEASL